MSPTLYPTLGPSTPGSSPPGDGPPGDYPLHKNSPQTAVIVGAVLGALLLLLLVAFILVWFRMRKNRNQHTPPVSEAFLSPLPELENTEIADQRQELPTQYVASPAELPMGRSYSRYELDPNTGGA